MNTRFFRKCIFLVCMTVFLSSPLFCAPKKTKKKTSDTTTAEADNLQTEQNKKAADDSNSTDGKIDTSEAVKLEIQKRTFFHKIDEQIVLQVENGTPQSLKNAMQKMRRADPGRKPVLLRLWEAANARRAQEKARQRARICVQGRKRHLACQCDAGVYHAAGRNNAPKNADEVRLPNEKGSARGASGSEKGAGKAPRSNV